MKKQRIKGFFKSLSTNQMLRKKPIQSKQQLLLRYPVNCQEIRKVKLLMKNQINLKHICISKTPFAKQNQSCEAQRNISG